MTERNVKKDYQLNTLFIIHPSESRYIYVYKEKKKSHGGPMVLQPFSPKVKTSSPRCTHSLYTFSPDLTKKENLTLLLQYSLLISLRQKVRKERKKQSSEETLVFFFT